MAEATDTRIVYGALCVWWDDIHKVGKNSSGLPCCPHCRGVLMEMPDIETWNEGVEKYAKDTGDDQYPAFIEWLRGKCFRTIAEARGAFNRETAS